MDRSARVLSAALGRIVAAKAQEVAALAAKRSALRAAAAAQPPARPFASALRVGETVSVIAEFKRRSPSAGWIREGADAASIASGYAAAGAAAISVLTDRTFFGGDLTDLQAVRGAVGLPVLRKDFVLDAVQLYETRAAGADAVLLIARILDGGQLDELQDEARQLGLGVLVEVHDAFEVERALATGAAVIGVNNRDLDTFRTDRSLAARLGATLPPDRVAVAESGIAAATHVDEIGRAGLDAVLVGETLMRAPDPAAALRALVGRRRVERGVRAGQVAVRSSREGGQG